MIFNCLIYSIDAPYNDIIISNLDSQISLTDNQLNKNKLKKSICIVERIEIQLDYRS